MKEEREAEREDERGQGNHQREEECESKQFIMNENKKIRKKEKREKKKHQSKEKREKGEEGEPEPKRTNKKWHVTKASRNIPISSASPLFHFLSYQNFSTNRDFALVTLPPNS